MPPPETALRTGGYAVFPADVRTRHWAEAAWRAARPLIASDTLRAQWMRCEQTWFAGVDLLPNAPDGSVAGVPLAGPARAMLGRLGWTPQTWHAGQVSVTYPGYPRPREGESAGAARYRMTRDAAHVDGLLPEAGGRRVLREPHAFILGLPLNEAAPDAAPLVLWPGSHRLLGLAFSDARRAAAGHPAQGLDLTDAYKAARRAAFERCARVPVPLRPGEAILLHRHMLHGIAPWTALPDPSGRAVAYFRPQLGEAEGWFRPDAL